MKLRRTGRAPTLAGMGAERPITPADEEALRAQGLRARTVWLPDVSSPEFLEQVRLGCLAIRENDERWADDELWVEAMTDDLLDSLPPWSDD